MPLVDDRRENLPREAAVLQRVLPALAHGIRPRRALALLAAALLGGGCTRPPSQAPQHGGPEPTADRSTAGVVVRYMGVSSLLLDTGDSAVLVDGFVTRPPLRRFLWGDLVSNDSTVDWALGKLGSPKIAAVVVTHAHFDHALDAPTFARKAKAHLVGSASTIEIGRAAGLDPSRLRVIRHGDTLRAAGMEIVFIRSLHGRPDLDDGEVDPPFDPPEPRRRWQRDTVYTLQVRSGQCTMLINGSAAADTIAMRDVRAQVVYLGLGFLGFRRDAAVEAYWRAMVMKTGARRVIPVHWDNLFERLEGPVLAPQPLYGRAMRHIARRSNRDSVDLRIPGLWVADDPFSPLPDGDQVCAGR